MNADFELHIEKLQNIRSDWNYIEVTLYNHTSLQSPVGSVTNLVIIWRSDCIYKNLNKLEIFIIIFIKYRILINSAFLLANQK